MKPYELETRLASFMNGNLPGHGADMIQPMTPERLAEIRKEADGKWCSMATKDMLRELEREVSRLAAEREEALKAVSEHFAAMDAFVNLGPTVAWLLQRDNEHVKQLATLAAENERLRGQLELMKAKAKDWEECGLENLQSELEWAGKVNGLTDQLAAAAATIERQREAYRAAVFLNDRCTCDGCSCWRKPFEDLAVARELEGKIDG